MTLRLRVRVRTVAFLAVVLAACAAVPAGAKAPGPNGRIAFQRSDPAADDSFVFTANPDGSHAQQLLPFHAGGPHWSPDGSRVAVGACLDPPVCDTAAVIVNPDNGSYRGLMMPDPTLFTGCVLWSPDGKRFACEGQGQNDPSRNGIYTILSSNGRGLTRITSNPGGDDIPIDYSPDGRQIVFSRTDPTFRHTALFVANVDGGAPQRITPWGFSDDDGSWSPDGTLIAFASNGSLYTVHPDGTDLAKVPLAVGSPSNAFDVGWSPDGTKITFSLFGGSSPGTGQEGIFTADADGSHVAAVTNSPTRDEKADWGSHPLSR